MSDQSSVPDKNSLTDFALGGMSLSKMTGVHLAVHAVPDAFLLMHTGVGCKYKTGVQSAIHDWVDHPNRREGWTQVDEMALIRGSSARIGPFARSWYDRRRPGVMVLTSAYFLELIGDDIRSEARATQQTLPCPLLYVPTAPPTNGLFGGYAETMLEMLQIQPWERESWTEPNQATIVGHFFHRYEQDGLADIAELGRLLKVAGLTIGPVLFSGRPWQELREAWRSRHVIELPYARPVEQSLARLFRGREVLATDLPMGFSGTARWLREVTRQAGGSEARTEAWIDREQARVRPLLKLVEDRVRGESGAVFGDAPLAAGLVTLLDEIGLTTRLVGLRGRGLGGERDFRETLARNGVSLPDECVVLEQPSLATILERVLSAKGDGRVSFVIGSSIELSLFHAAADPTSSRPLALLETGYPSNHYHVVSPSPALGFRGVISWAQRILDIHSLPYPSQVNG